MPETGLLSLEVTASFGIDARKSQIFLFLWHPFNPPALGENTVYLFLIDVKIFL